MTQIRHLPAPASDHSRQQQVFNIQPVICQTEFPRQFLVPRLSLVPDLAMELGQLQLCLSSVVRAFLLAGQGTVRSLQFRQGSFQRLRCLVRYPIAAREEYFQAEVQTSGFTRLDSVYWLILTVYDKIHKQVSAGIPLDRHSFDRAINLTGLRKLVHRFPDLELVVFQQLPPGLGQREGLRLLDLPERWRLLVLLAKELLIAQVYPLNNVLNGLRAQLLPVRILGPRLQLRDVFLQQEVI